MSKSNKLNFQDPPHAHWSILLTTAQATHDYLFVSLVPRCLSCKMLEKPTFWKLLDSNLLSEEFVVNIFVCKLSEIYWKTLCLIITCVAVFKGVFKGPSSLLTKIFLLFTWHRRLPWQKLALGGDQRAHGVVLLFIKKLGVWCLACINNIKMHGNRGKSGFVRLCFDW